MPGDRLARTFTELGVAQGWRHRTLAFPKSADLGNGEHASAPSASDVPYRLRGRGDWAADDCNSSSGPDGADDSYVDVAVVRSGDGAGEATDDRMVAIGLVRPLPGRTNISYVLEAAAVDAMLRDVEADRP